jgi:copper chaperone CopZ
MGICAMHGRHQKNTIYMRHLLSIISIFLFHVSYGQVESVSLQASGLTCSMCSRAIYKSLVKVPGVAKVTEDIEHSSYLIEFKDQGKISPDDLKKAVRDAGFSVARMELRANFNHVAIPANAPLLYGGISFVFVGTDRQELNGEQRLIVVDKDFLSDKERQKYARVTENAPAGAARVGDRVYHVVIRQS